MTFHYLADCPGEREGACCENATLGKSDINTNVILPTTDATRVFSITVFFQLRACICSSFLHFF